MLVLSRRRCQKIIINGNIVITILNTDAYQVKIGIDAPKDVSVNRHEIQERIDKENRGNV